MPQGRAGAARKRNLSQERSYARKIADLIAFLVPFLLLVGLALSGGGYDLLARHLAGILAWVLVAVLLLGPWPDRLRPGRSLALIGGLLLLLAILSALSSIWSSSVSSSLTEAERVIGYLGFFIASYLTMRTPKQREWFARGLAAGLAVIVLLALGDRLLPGGEPGAVPGLDRLSYPLGYWNANGICAAAALVLFTWFATVTGSRGWRAGCVAVAILSGTALYLTYSRGGLLVAAVAIILLCLLTARRLRVLATLVAVVAGTVPILLTVNLYPEISGDSFGDPLLGESLIVIIVAVAASLLAAAILEGLLQFSHRHQAATLQARKISKDRKVLTGFIGAGVAALIVLSLAFGQNVWDQFTDDDVPVPTDAQSRLTELSGSWRYEFNRVALDTFSDHPTLGSGAGTYPIEWSRRRSVPVVTQDAHSFYLENLAELGIPGGLIALSLAISLLALAASASYRHLGREAPVILALTTGVLFSLAFDWFWKLGATAVLLMSLAAWIASAEAVDPNRSNTGSGSGFRVVGLLAVWISIVVLAVPALADYYVEASADSVRAGKVDRAYDQARSASMLEPWSPDPHMQLGTIAEGRGQYARALAEYNKALDLEPDNWHALVLRFGLNYNAGNLRAAQADYARLREINPLYFSQYSFEEIQQITS